jgi:Flp pilus assembly protein TadB
MPMLDVVDDWRRSPFDKCESLSEVLIVAHAALGLAGVAQIVASAVLWRENLQEAAGQFHKLGLTDLARLLRRAARRAPERPLSARERLAQRMERKNHA